MKTITLKNGIELKLATESDASELFRVVNGCRKYLAEWLPWVEESKFEKDTLEFILARKRAYKEGRGLTCTIRFDSKIVGIISFIGFNKNTASAEIGYWIQEKSQGHGIISQSCAALVAYGFETLKLNRIVIRCAEENVKSRAIPERLGFVYEGTQREAAVIKKRRISLRCYSQLAAEYPET